MRLIISKKQLLYISAAAIIVTFTVVSGIIFALNENNLPPKYNGFTRKTSAGAVASNGLECGPIGAAILKQNGSAVDAAIAVMLCEEVTCPQSTGIGGGFLATVYNRQSGTAETLDAREAAPLAATEDMFVGNGDAALEGGLAIATPGVIRGFWELHQRYGKLQWKSLFEPTIDLCRKGIVVSSTLAEALTFKRATILSVPSLREVLVNPDTQDVWQEGDTMKREVLAETLDAIANEGMNAMYEKGGSILTKLMQDLRSFGSILTEEDFINYRPRWSPTVFTTIRDKYTVHSMPLSGSGANAIFMLNILDGYKELDIDNSSTWHRIIESFKHAYGQRTRLGDADFVPGMQDLIRNLTSKSFADGIREKISDNKTFTDYQYYGAEFAEKVDHGTAHVSVLAPNGDAVALTATINTYFGCKRRSPSTGIILNNIMDDFSTPGVTNNFGVPASPANYVAPGKRPLSSMTPTIVVDNRGEVRMVVGAAGGTTITTATVLMILRHVFFGQDLKTVINAPRIHHQLAPMAVDVEEGFDERIIDRLAERGHVVRRVQEIASVTAIARESDGRLSAAYDPNRGGSWVIVDQN